MLNPIDHYALEPDLPALKRALDTYQRGPALAVHELTHLAESGSPMGMIFLGHVYRRAMGVAKDLSQAETLYRRAADMGSVMALFELGKLYVEQTRYADAKQAFRLASAAGYAPATYRLGLLHYLGRGVEKDIRKAKSLWEDASASGHVIARNHLGQLLIRMHASIPEFFRGILLFARSYVDGCVVLCVEGFGSDRVRR